MTGSSKSSCQCHDLESLLLPVRAEFPSVAFIMTPFDAKSFDNSHRLFMQSVKQRDQVLVRNSSKGRSEEDK